MQTIREIVGRPVTAKPKSKPRGGKARQVDLLRSTAEGLGVVLDDLSYSVTGPVPGRAAPIGDDPGDDSIDGGRRTRGFKLHVSSNEMPVAETETELADELAEERSEALGILKEARSVVADAIAPPIVMPAQERVAAQERLRELFAELSAKRVEVISSIFSNVSESATDVPSFSLATSEAARAAYNGIDDMIMRLLNAGRDVEAADAVGADPAYSGHEAAISATEQLKQFLMNEGPEKAFSRFREVNRSNILGLLM